MKHELSKELLERTIADWEAARNEIPFGLGEEGDNTLAALKFALAAHEQGPVAVPNHLTYLKAPTISNILANDDESPMANAARILAIEVNFWRSVPLYTHPAPSIPAAVPDLSGVISELEKVHDWILNTLPVPTNSAVPNARRVRDVLAACRTAMLQSEPVSQPYKLPDGWIPVRERLPLTPSADCTYRDIEVNAFDGERVFTAHYAIGSLPHLWGDWVDTAASITHWQPLPAAPKS